MFINGEEIILIVDYLNSSNLEYIFLRNINREIPYRIPIGKDIDILIKEADKHIFLRFFRKHHYKIIAHPLRNDIFLYGVNRFIQIEHNVSGIIFDIMFQIAVRSLDAGQWVPLDQRIQKSAWHNRRFQQVNGSFGYWTLGYDDEFVTLVSRAIFDKRKFQSAYIQRLKDLLPKVNMDKVEKKLYMIFFKYTPFLLKSMCGGDFGNIIKEQLSFKGY